MEKTMLVEGGCDGVREGRKFAGESGNIFKQPERHNKGKEAWIEGKGGYVNEELGNKEDVNSNRRHIWKDSEDE